MNFIKMNYVSLKDLYDFASHNHLDPDVLFGSTSIGKKLPRKNILQRIENKKGIYFFFYIDKRDNGFYLRTNYIGRSKSKKGLKERISHHLGQERWFIWRPYLTSEEMQKIQIDKLNADGRPDLIKSYLYDVGRALEKTKSSHLIYTYLNETDDTIAELEKRLICGVDPVYNRTEYNCRCKGEFSKDGLGQKAEWIFKAYKSLAFQLREQCFEINIKDDPYEQVEDNASQYDLLVLPD